jgi:hypothetical protein
MNNVNSIGDFIGSVFSTLIDKNHKLFKALFADSDGTGTIEKIFNDIEGTQRIWCNTSNVYEQEGEQFEKTISYFSILNRLFDEDDVSFKGRNKLLYCRNGDTVWGDRWNIVKMFKAYFKSEQVYIINNTNDLKENLLDNGDFEEKNTSWTLERCNYSSEACFSGRTGVKFDQNGICRQTVAITSDATYFMHLFMYGIITIRITDNNGRYWKPGNKRLDDFGTWVTYPEHIPIKHTQQWEPVSIFFLTDQRVSEVTITFEGIEDQVSYIDYVRLFNKEAYPSFTLIAVFSGHYTQETMAMAPGRKDPMVMRNYEGFKHFSEGRHDADKTDYEGLSFIEQAALNTEEGTVDTTDYDKLNHFSGGEHDVDETDYDKLSFSDQAALNTDEGIIDKTDYKQLSFIENAALNSDEITNYKGFDHYSGGGPDADKTDKEKLNYLSGGEHDVDETDYDKLSFSDQAALNTDEGIIDKTDYKQLSFVEGAALNRDKDPIMAGEAIKAELVEGDKDPIMAGEVIKAELVENDKDPIMAGGTNDIGEITKANDAYIDKTILVEGTNDIGEIVNTNDAYIEGMPLAPLNRDKDPIMAGEVIKAELVENDKDPIMAGGTNDIGEVVKANDAYIDKTILVEGTNDLGEIVKANDAYIEGMPLAPLNRDKDPIMAGEANKAELVEGDKDPIMAGGTNDIGAIVETNDGYIDETIMAGKVIKAELVENDKDPILAEGTNDLGEIASTNDAYIEGVPLAPWNNDKPGITVDYSKMSYVEQHHIFGAAGTAQKVIYNELLEVVQAAGIISYIEIIIKDLD